MGLVGLALVVSAHAAAGIDAVTGRQAVPRPNAESVPSTSNPRSTYVLHCAGCHGMQGAGSLLSQVPDMRRVGLFLNLPGGREFLIKVPGVMGSGLNDQQIAEVSNWVLTQIAPASVPKDFQPYQAEEVRQARAQPMVDVATTRAELVRQAQLRGIALD